MKGAGVGGENLPAQGNKRLGEDFEYEGPVYRVGVNKGSANKIGENFLRDLVSELF